MCRRQVDDASVPVAVSRVPVAIGRCVPVCRCIAIAAVVPNRAAVTVPVATVRVRDDGTSGETRDPEANCGARADAAAVPIAAVAVAPVPAPKTDTAIAVAAVTAIAATEADARTPRPSKAVEASAIFRIRDLILCGMSTKQTGPCSVPR